MKICVTNRHLCDGDFYETVRKACETAGMVILREKDLTDEERFELKAYNAYRNFGRVAKDHNYSQEIRDLAEKCDAAAEELKEAQRTLAAFQKNGVPSTVYVTTR